MQRLIANQKVIVATVVVVVKVHVLRVAMEPAAVLATRVARGLAIPVAMPLVQEVVRSAPTNLSI